MKNIALCLGFFAGFLVTSTASLLDGFVTMKIWEWFIATNGWPSISLETCVGIHLIIGLASWQYTPKTNTESAIGIAHSFGCSATIFACAWFIHTVVF